MLPPGEEVLVSFSETLYELHGVGYNEQSAKSSAQVLLNVMGPTDYLSSSGTACLPCGPLYIGLNLAEQKNSPAKAGLYKRVETSRFISCMRAREPVFRTNIDGTVLIYFNALMVIQPQSFCTSWTVNY